MPVKTRNQIARERMDDLCNALVDKGLHVDNKGIVRVRHVSMNEFLCIVEDMHLTWKVLAALAPKWMIARYEDAPWNL